MNLNKKHPQRPYWSNFMKNLSKSRTKCICLNVHCHTFCLLRGKMSKIVEIFARLAIRQEGEMK